MGNFKSATQAESDSINRELGLPSVDQEAAKRAHFKNEVIERSDCNDILYCADCGEPETKRRIMRPCGLCDECYSKSKGAAGAPARS